MVIITGWIAVQRDVLIDFNLEEYSLEIKTNNALGSNDVVGVFLHTSQEDHVGVLFLQFTSTPVYNIGACSSNSANIPTNLPYAKDKVWRITLTRTSGIRLVVHCNEEEVLNTMISDSTCGKSDWNTY